MSILGNTLAALGTSAAAFYANVGLGPYLKRLALSKRPGLFKVLGLESVLENERRQDEIIYGYKRPIQASGELPAEDPHVFPFPVSNDTNTEKNTMGGFRFPVIIDMLGWSPSENNYDSPSSYDSTSLDFFEEFGIPLREELKRCLKVA